MRKEGGREVRREGGRGGGREGGEEGGRKGRKEGCGVQSECPTMIFESSFYLYCRRTQHRVHGSLRRKG